MSHKNPKDAKGLFQVVVFLTTLTLTEKIANHLLSIATSIIVEFVQVLAYIQILGNKS